MALVDETRKIIAGEMPAGLGWNPAPALPSDGKQLIDSATLSGINKGINDAEYQRMAQEYAANEAELQKINNQFLQSGLLGPTPQEQAMYQADLTNEYLTNLVGAKQAYQNAQVSQDEAGMINASLAGQQLREQGRAAGIDPALLSEDLTLDQARALQKQADMQSAFGGMSADDYYQVQYNRYRDQGMGYTAAKRAAGEDAAQYQSNQLARMSNSLFRNGFENGALTQDGMAALMRMSQISDEGKEMVNAIVNMVPGMKDMFALNAQRTLAGDKHGYHQEDMVLGGNIDMKKAEQKHAYDEETANNNLQRTIAQMEAAMNINAMGIQAQAQARAGIAAALGLSGDAATRYITTGHIDAPKSAGGGKGSGFDNNRAKFLQGERDRLDGQIEEARASGDEAKVKSLEAQRDEIQAEIDAMRTGGSSSQQNSSGMNIDVNNYDSLRDVFQQLVNENAERSWDKQKTKAELANIFLANVGYDNPMAQKIVQEAEWGGPTDTGTAEAAERPKQEPTTSKASEPGTTAGNSGYRDNRSAAGRIWDAVSNAIAPGWVKVMRNGKLVDVAANTLKDGATPVTDAYGKILYYNE